MYNDKLGKRDLQVVGRIANPSYAVALRKSRPAGGTYRDSFTGLTTVKAGTLALGGADLQGGQLLFDYAGTSPAATIESILAAGYAAKFAPGSACIYSSTAAANGWVLGWADNGAGVVTVAPVLPGDANWDGRVDINDLTVVLTNFGGTGMTWQGARIK